MNKKKTRIILIVVVVFIWLAVIYRIFSYINKSKSPEIPLPIMEESTGAVSFQDTFKLLADYRNPFTNASYMPVKTKTVSKPVVKQVIKQVNWPSVVYNGKVKNQQSGEELAMIKINNQEHLMRTGEIANNITLVKMSNDFVELSYEGESKTVNK